VNLNDLSKEEIEARLGRLRTHQDFWVLKEIISNRIQELRDSLEIVDKENLDKVQGRLKEIKKVSQLF
jgi:hypothetical protein